MTEDGNVPVVLVTVPTEMEAAVVVNALSAQGIKATASGGLTSAFRAEAPGGTKVLVRETDLDRAKRILAEARSELADIDWSQVDLGDRE